MTPAHYDTIIGVGQSDLTRPSAKGEGSAPLKKHSPRFHEGCGD